MTIILGHAGRETIWMVADRRLTFSSRRTRDDARKMLLLDATDGPALIGYAGFGLTALGTEPSDWISRVLRGRSGTIQECLGWIALAFEKELAPKMRATSRARLPSHHFVSIGFASGKPVIHVVEAAWFADGTAHKLMFRFTRFENQHGLPPPFAVSGSGAIPILAQAERLKSLKHLSRAHDRGVLSSLRFADELASLAFDTSRKETTVGPSSIVVWRYRDGRQFKGGGGHQFYRDGIRILGDASIPTISRGQDTIAMIDAILPHMLDEHGRLKQNGIDSSAINAALRLLPYGPDDKLR